MVCKCARTNPSLFLELVGLARVALDIVALVSTIDAIDLVSAWKMSS